MRKELEKVYDPKQVEDRIYDFWVGGNYFHAEPNPEKKPFTIVIPPPNITGQLHMGHALDNTLQDILIRHKRMDGYETLWMPGTDHASIATEAKIVAALANEGLTKKQIGREEFLRRAWEWKKQYVGRIIQQLKKLGSSCDRERERFTLDEGCSKAVREVFCRLYEKGLIYRGERMINWYPNCKTSLSDAEVEYQEKAGSFWHIRYPLSDGSGDVIVATTRPETMLGDTGLAINPNDEERAHLIGKTCILPLVGREIPIVADDYVELGFGTGVVKMTPAHDPNDYEVGLRHNLEIINVMNENGTINEKGGKYAGMDRFECRKAIVSDLKEQGFLVKVEDYTHNVGCCQRCSTVVEPRLSTQWFVDMKPLAVPAVKAVREGETRFVPERFDQIYFHFMENIRDWCISRQLWWGHEIPAWYCDDCGEIIVSREDAHTCPKCGSTKLTHDPDTLDTWFSSALWPFSTLGWPNETEELKYFFPTDVLVTGYDIIFFWVARMIFSSIEQMGEVPFKDVLIHGLVRDAQGRKMSKSLGNGIDPLEVIDAYGADALRLTLAMGTSPGNDMRFSDEKVKASRNFCNKIWNAARFIMMNLGDEDVKNALPENLTNADKWVLTHYNTLVKEVSDNLDKYELGVAVTKLYDFIWDIFCDWYIEIAKPRLNSGGEEATAVKQVLVYVLSNTLALLHPFLPFITEEIWQALPHEGESLMVASWPKYDEGLNFAKEAAEFEMVMDAIRAIRNARTNANVPPSKKATVYINSERAEVFANASAFIEKLAYASSVVTVDKDFAIERAMHVVTDAARIFLPMDELVDREKELARLNKELAACEKDIEMVDKKLSNENFVAKAPAKVIEGEKLKREKALERLEKIKESLAALG
ncbi:MAG: valine--tRNA ligase [Oscillospiraceae bacterium]|nr:valine--tRNA ligase [Oscillospiraceae bacterium]